MNDVIERISLYQNLYQICFALSMVFLIVSVTVFFMLDIRSTIGYLTGRRAKKQIRALEEANAESGRLITRGKGMQYVDSQMKNDMGVRQAAALGIRKVEYAVEPAETSAQTDLPTDRNRKPVEGMKMGQSMKRPAEETAIFTDATVKLREKNSTKIREDSPGEMQGKFLIVRELMLIHTEEVI